MRQLRLREISGDIHPVEITWEGSRQAALKHEWGHCVEKGLD